MPDQFANRRQPAKYYLSALVCADGQFSVEEKLATYQERVIANQHSVRWKISLYSMFDCLEVSKKSL